MASKRPEASVTESLLKANEIESLGDLLADFLTNMDALEVTNGQRSETKEVAAVASPSTTAGLSPTRTDTMEVQVMEERDRTFSVGRKHMLPTHQRPSDALNRKNSTHKRVWSASAHDSAPRSDKNKRSQPLPLPLLLFHRDGSNERERQDQGEVDDESGRRRRKMPRLGAQASWLLAPGLSLDEKRLALPLLFNERMSYEPEADAPVFAALECSVRGQLAGLDDVFRSEGLTPSVTSTRRSHVEPSGENGPFLKFVSAKLLPFSLEVIAEAMRQFTLQSALQCHATDKTPPNVVYAKQRYYLRPDRASDSAGVPLLLRCVFQHATEGDRMLGVWSGTGEWPDEVASQHNSSAPIREQGWVLIRRCPGVDSKGGPHSSSPPPPSSLSRCLVQSCLYVTPGLSDGAIRSDKSYLDVLSAVTAPSYQKLIDEREQLFENRFMDRMLQIRAQQRVCPPGYSRSSSL